MAAARAAAAAVPVQGEQTALLVHEQQMLEHLQQAGLVHHPQGWLDYLRRAQLESRINRAPTYGLATALEAYQRDHPNEKPPQVFIQVMESEADRAQSATVKRRRRAVGLAESHELEWRSLLPARESAPRPSSPLQMDAAHQVP